MRTLTRFPLLAALVSLAGCGPAPVPETPPTPPPTPPPPAAPAVTSPARWLVRHPEVLTATASRKLPSGGVLHGSAGGHRWITPDGSAPPPPPAADGGASAPGLETASMILPERIVAILPVEQRWAFFGSSGRVFLAATPLGAIDEVRQPPSPVQAVSAGKAAAVAATRGGELLRTTDGGAHWTPLQVPGLSPAVPFSVALRPDGAGAVIAAPQRAMVTRDDGASWAPIALPAGPHVLDLSENGEVWLATPGYRLERTHRLDGAAFLGAKSKSAQSHSRDDKDAVRYENDSDTTRAIAGKRVMSVGRPNNSDPWKVKVSELDHDGEWAAVKELADCIGSQTPVSGFGDEFVVGCMRKVEAAEGDKDKKDKAQFRIVMLRTRDGGATWAEEGEAPLWNTWARIVAGPDGSVLLQRRCSDKNHDCTQLAVRPAAAQPFAPITTPPDAEYRLFGVDAAHRRFLTAGIVDKGKARFESWALDGSGGKITDLFPMKNGAFGTLAVDAHGAIVVVAMVEKDWKVLRSTDEGATFASEPLSADVKVREVGFAGDRGLLLDDSGHYWETATAGKTWAPATGLATGGRHQIACSREGCMIGNEVRLGWDLAGESAVGLAVAAPAEPKDRAKVMGAAPLRCVAGESKAIAGALVDDLGELATAAPSGRIVVPAASKGNGLDLVVLTASDNHLTGKPTSIFGAAPNEKVTGSQTEVMLTPAGAIATRATYPVDSSYADVWLSPVSAELAWWKPETGKVVHGRLPPMGKGHMRGRFSLGHRGEKEELLSIIADGAVWRPRFTYGEPAELFTFNDKGTSKKIVSPLLSSARGAVNTPAGLALLELGSGEPSVAGFGFPKDKDKGAGPTVAWTLAPPGGRATILPLQRGDDAAFVVAWAGGADGPAHGFVVPLKQGDNPAEVTDLGLASLLTEKPRACGDTQEAGSVRFVVALPRAARRPVLVEGADKPMLARAEGVVVVVPPKGQPCVSDWVAQADSNDIVLVSVGSLGRAWVASGPPAEWKEGVSGRDLTVRALRCEEAAGLTIPASFNFKGF